MTWISKTKLNAFRVHGSPALQPLVANHAHYWRLPTITGNWARTRAMLQITLEISFIFFFFFLANRLEHRKSSAIADDYYNISSSPPPLPNNLTAPRSLNTVSISVRCIIFVKLNTRLITASLYNNQCWTLLSRYIIRMRARQNCFSYRPPVARSSRWWRLAVVWSKN